MKRDFAFVTGLVLLLVIRMSPAFASRPGRCDGSPWFQIEVNVDSTSLPSGVSVTSRVKSEYRDPLFRNTISVKNTSNAPLILVSSYDLIPKLEASLESPSRTEGRAIKKIQSGIGFHFFENGVPMQGKSHLKGWVATRDAFGENLDSEQIFPSLIPDLAPKQMLRGKGRPSDAKPPRPEPVVLKIFYGGKLLNLRATYRYGLNSNYDPAACN